MLHKKYKLSLLSLALISAFTYAEEQLEEIHLVIVMALTAINAKLIFVLWGQKIRLF